MFYVTELFGGDYLILPGISVNTLSKKEYQN